MGKKGDKSTSYGAEVAENLLDQLAPITGITAKKMFGGHGLFHDDKMFGMVDSKGQCLLKATDETKQDFLDSGSEKHSRMPYYMIPDEILAEEHKLLVWARIAIEASKG